jgi:hypothetical protein
MEVCRCKVCGNPSLVPGHLLGAEGSQVVGFAPAATYSHVRLRAACRACFTCGHVELSVAPGELRNSIELHGKELVKQYFRSIDAGTYHDLPDIPEARRAADGVAEIDSLILSGNELEAKRRYRQLAGKTWDEVNAMIPTWVDLTRARKLALFGWRPKGKLDAEEDSEQREHPMHDRLLDC